MIKASDIMLGVYGAWRLARRDVGGLKLMDTSPQGFFNSFWAAALLLPGYLVLQVLDGSFETGFGRPLLVGLIAYVIRWTAFPLAMAHVAAQMGKASTYPRFIVAYNWSAVIQMALLLPTAVLAHIFPGGGFAFLNLMAVAVLLAYQAYIAHVALDVGLGSAVGVVVMDILLDALVQMTADRLLV